MPNRTLHFERGGLAESKKSADRDRERGTSSGWERVKGQPDRGARGKETRERSVNLHGSEDKKGTREGEMPMGL